MRDRHLLSQVPGASLIRFPDVAEREPLAEKEA